MANVFAVWVGALLVFQLVQSEEVPDSEKWKKKDVRDYTDADLERLLEQWEVWFLSNDDF